MSKAEVTLRLENLSRKILRRKNWKRKGNLQKRYDNLLKSSLDKLRGRTPLSEVLDEFKK